MSSDMIARGMAAAAKNAGTDTANNLAAEFDETASYEEGDYVTYGGKFWRFNADHAAGEWDGTDAEIVTIGGELSRLFSLIDPDYP